MAELHIVGQILGGSGFTSQNIFCKVWHWQAQASLACVALKCAFNRSCALYLNCSGASCRGAAGSCWRALTKGKRS